MSVTDPIGDMLARIRNAQERGKSKVTTPASRLRERVLEVLQNEGFIRSFATVQQGTAKAEIEIELKYFDGAPVIREIQRVSKPGRLGISILSTPKGVMSDAEARSQNVGGEVICTVF
jgi:small subunit ribosomal protein S8